MPSLGCLADLEAKGGSGASAISRIGFGAVGDVAQLDFKSRHPWRGRKARSRHTDLYVADGNSIDFGDGAQPFQLEPRITLQKLPWWKCGSLSARTSALTLPKVVSGLCLLPS